VYSKCLVDDDFAHLHVTLCKWPGTESASCHSLCSSSHKERHWQEPLGWASPRKPLWNSLPELSWKVAPCTWAAALAAQGLADAGSEEPGQSPIVKALTLSVWCVNLPTWPAPAHGG
jgi:hypothetical protein